MKPQLVKAATWHRRLGSVQNAFRYNVDYVLFEPENTTTVAALFSHNRANLMAIHDSDHGGLRNDGTGPLWVRRVALGFGLELPSDWYILLLAQPRIFGTRFTPVSFWFILDAEGRIRAVLAEVNNTFGDRHSYFCARPDFTPIGPADVLDAQKVFHVSPFQPVDGTYRFTFSLNEAFVSVNIDYRHANGGLVASLQGSRRALTSRAIIGVVLRRPLGAFRVLGLIHWQALKLWRKHAGFYRRPLPPTKEVSR